MIFAEKLIDGVLHHRMGDKGDWTPYTVQELSGLVASMTMRCTEIKKLTETLPRGGAACVFTYMEGETDV